MINAYKLVVMVAAALTAFTNATDQTAAESCALLDGTYVAGEGCYTYKGAVIGPVVVDTHASWCAGGCAINGVCPTTLLDLN